MSKLKIGLIGASYIAKKHLEVIKDVKGIDVVAITSRTLTKAIALSKQFNIKNVFKNSDELINKTNLDGIMILVSSEEIFKVTKNLLPYKIPLFIEKPPGINFQETHNLCKLANKFNVINMVGFNRRYYSNFLKGINIINKHGKLVGITIEGHERYWKIEKLISKKNRDNLLYSNSSHVIDLFRFFAGEIKSIKSFSTMRFNKKSDQFASAIKFKNGVLGNYIANWFSPSGWSVTLHGEKVMVKFKPLENSYWVDENFKEHKISMSSKDIKYKSGFYYQILAYKKMIINNKTFWPSQSLNDSLNTFKLVKIISSGE